MIDEEFQLDGFLTECPPPPFILISSQENSCLFDTTKPAQNTFQHPHHFFKLKVCSALYVLIQHDQVHLPALQLSNYSYFCFIRRSIILDRQQQHQHHFPIPRVPIVAANYHPATAPWTGQHQI